MLADTVALFGGLIMALLEIGQSQAYYMGHVLGALTIIDVVNSCPGSMVPSSQT